MSAEAGPILSAEKLSVGYGKKTVIDGIDLHLDHGEVLLILGHNGAGKTTLMRGIFGLIKPQAGRVLHEGADITGRRPAENVMAGIAFVPQGHGIFPSLSVRENLDLGAFVVHDTAHIPDNLKIVFEMFPILEDRIGQIAGTLSGGQQQMLALGMALMHRPKVIILDEPSIGLAPNLVDTVMKSVKAINQRFGTSILMVEQSVNYGLPIADRAVVIKTGRKVYDGPPSALEDRVELIKYF
ncbi:MAG: ABC transporter ATP-binding protein [Alphaproteobacteria bacterium]